LHNGIYDVILNKNNNRLKISVKEYMDSQLLPKDIVKAAWQVSGVSQVKFAAFINKSQPMLSKYISGAVLPPADVLILCMNKCGLLGLAEVSAATLAQRVRLELDGAAYAGTRVAINQILDSISGHNNTASSRA